MVLVYTNVVSRFGSNNCSDYRLPTAHPTCKGSMMRRRRKSSCTMNTLQPVKEYEFTVLINTYESFSSRQMVSSKGDRI